MASPHRLESYGMEPKVRETVGGGRPGGAAPVPAAAIVIRFREAPRAALFGAAIVLSLGCLMDCGRRASGDRGGVSQMAAKKTVQQVLKENIDRWTAIPGVVGAGIGECKGQPCIKVLVTEKSEQVQKRIPSQVEGFPVMVEVTGEIRALDTDGKARAE